MWQSQIAEFIKRFSPIVLAVFFLAIAVNGVSAKLTPGIARPKVILISLDGATPRLVEEYLSKGILSPNQGLGLLKRNGIVAQQNVTCTASLTAACHIAIGTGSTAAHNDINSNSFHLVASPFIQTIAGFAAPIGGYSIGNNQPNLSPAPTAEPLWIALRDSGKKVVAATFPGADGADITVPGLNNSMIIQPASQRTVDYTVPFGAFAGASSQGFSLTSTDFSAAPQTTTDQLTAADKVSYSPVLQKTNSLDSFTVGGIKYDIQVAALDTTNDSVTNYDTLVFFDANQGIKPGPFSLPSTGPAYVRANNTSSPFYLEGSSNKAGTGFYVSQLAPDLSTVRLVRYSANYIPRNRAVLADVDDINNNVGFWADQADYRITERLSSGLDNFPDSELEAIYEDQVRTFVDYQTRVALRAISQNPNADLAMVYIEQPDGSEHQFFITEPRQATDPQNPNTIGAGQDQAKIARYQRYVQTAYRVANNAVGRIIDAVGTDSKGTPKSNIIVVSDHGFAPFHTSVDMNNFLKNSGFDLNKVRAVTSGPAANIYINLKGREPNGTVSPEEYVTLQQQIISALKAALETNSNYTLGSESVPLFDKIYSRPVPKDLNDPSFGLGTSEFIGQDAGDVFALLTEGYNFDGTQNPPVQRLGDAPSNTPVLSVSNFYGAHGYDPTIPNMSAILYAAGPDIGRGTLAQIRNIDVAPTIDQLLGVKPSPTVDGNALNLVSTPAIGGM
jgi:predicted AlkP superfamily pyrophosphatase or phosphodiesterase